MLEFRKQQHGMAELYRAGEPVFKRSEFTGLDFFGSFLYQDKNEHKQQITHFKFHKIDWESSKNYLFRVDSSRQK